ncbi:MAG TPA: 4-hydroxybenzoate 3-monooxygenase [Terriglobales bacterium]|nr:4-hydroxybenzoate 3-monooxygenase [Terriglobales bacterium]
MRTQVGIVGAGPAGLMLSHLLHLRGIESVILEARSRQYCEERVRAGVLEQGTANLLAATGVGERMKREALIHRGLEFRFREQRLRLEFEELAGGRSIMIYAQSEVIKDLADARLAAGGQIFFEAEDVSVEGFDGPRPTIRFRKDGKAQELACDFIAGCDGFHGVCRPSVPAGVLTSYERVYPFGWLGILAEAPPSNDEVIYAHHPRGFALHSMRSMQLSRLYLQCHPEENLEEWPDERIWSELQARLAVADGWKLVEGPVVQKGVTGMRSFVIEPMQYGRLFLAGDAAHIVPPTGAKGLNLAVADVRLLAHSLAEFYDRGTREWLDGYSERCLLRVWKVQRFSWWLTSILHQFPEASPFDRRRQLAELDYIAGSRIGAQALAENYVGLPMDVPDGYGE